MRTLLLLPLLVLPACGGEDVVSTEPGPQTSLSIEFRPEPDASPTRWTLTCDPAGGTHPDPEAACRDLAAAEDPFAPLPADAVCTEQYGGPQTAVVQGTYRGEPVDITLQRTNGCYISQWESLGAVLPSVS